MTAIALSDCTIFEGFCGDLKFISIQTPGTAASGGTIDLGTDSVGGHINTILNTLLQDDLGADKTAAFAQSTGIITLGTITTGIHELTVWGI